MGSIRWFLPPETSRASLLSPSDCSGRPAGTPLCLRHRTWILQDLTSLNPDKIVHLITSSGEIQGKDLFLERLNSFNWDLSFFFLKLRYLYKPQKLMILSYCNYDRIFYKKKIFDSSFFKLTIWSIAKKENRTINI